jgi:UbiD family decarboxylase
VIYKDLREFIAEVETVNLLRHIHGAHTNLEIGGITEVAAGLPECPALLFDRIAGYPAGFRVFTNPVNTPQRAALAVEIDPNLRPVDALQAWMKKRMNLKIHSPVTVKDAAFLENTDEGDAVDIAKFPVPIWHRNDGGPYFEPRCACGAPLREGTRHRPGSNASV